jgi:penicillin-binding protein 1A
MPNDNNQKNTNNTQKNTVKKKKRRKKQIKIFRIIFLTLLVAFVIGGLIVGKMVLDVIKDAPKIDPTNVLSTLSQNSSILDQDGNLIEKIQAANENREIVELSKMPKYLQDAFIAIEDKRFIKHFGIDIRGLMGAFFSNIKSGDLKGRGASTITQQLVRNLYLTNQKSMERKIMEAYLSIQMERVLIKEQILENYLNTIPLGPSIHGVQAASYAYFSKDVSELTLAEAAILAGTPKSSARYTPYKRIAMDDLDGIAEDDIVGYIYVGSVKYACVYNPVSVERQKIVLAEMLSQKKISQEEYDAALKEDIKKALNPGESKIEGIASNNFTDYVKKQVIKDLMEQNKISYEEAESYLLKSGLNIYTTMDVNIQKSIEGQYENFGEIFVGKKPPESKPLAQDWTNFRWSGEKSLGTLDKYKNVLNGTGQVLYFQHSNIFNDKNMLYLLPTEYSIDKDGNLIINTNKLNIYSSVIDITDCYTIDQKNQMVTHNIGGLNIGKAYEVLDKKGNIGTIKILKQFLQKNTDFYTIGSDNAMTISNKYYKYDETGIVQPQSAAIIMDYKTGHIKAIFGGRDVTGDKTFNRAVDAVRQPGSTIKPVSVYIAALDHGYSAASVFDDLPMYNKEGQRWPKNWYEQSSGRAFKYKGIVSLRYAIQQSLNTVPVMLFEQLGTKTLVDYLAKLGMVDLENPANDTFVTPEENYAVNDMIPAAFSLGAFSKGFSPLVMTAAYGAIANDGVYIEPICYTKVEDSNGKLILEKVPKKQVVVAPEIAFILKDILRSSVAGSDGLAGPAAIKTKNANIEMAAKTGTTQDNGDFWCIGFSPYYVGGVWVGNDNPTTKLSETSSSTARLLGAFMTAIHEGLEPAKFQTSSDVSKFEICKRSGKLATELCAFDPRGSQVISEYFIKGTEPKDSCKNHIKVSICKDTLLLRSEFCPESAIIEKVLMTNGDNAPFDADLYPDVKDENYQALLNAVKLYKQVKSDIAGGMGPEQIRALHGGSVTINVTNSNAIEIVKVNGFTLEQLDFKKMLPEDYQYRVPSETCTFHTYNKWYENITKNGGSVVDPKDNNGNNGGNDNGNNGGNNNGGDNSGDTEGSIIETPDKPLDDSLITN